MSLEAQRALLRDIYGDAKWECPLILEELGRTRELYFDRVSQIWMNAWSKGRVALIGDAAFCVSLVAGQGSALAMLSAYVLAGELAKADGEHQQAFFNHQTLLRTFINEKQHAAERFASAFAPKTRWGMWCRNQVIRACAIPGVAKYAVGRDITDYLTLPRYPWS